MSCIVGDFTYCLFQYKKMFFTDYSDVYTEARVLCTKALHVGNLCPLHVLINVTLSIHNDVLHLGGGNTFVKVHIQLGHRNKTYTYVYGKQISQHTVETLSHNYSLTSQCLEGSSDCHHHWVEQLPYKKPKYRCQSHQDHETGAYSHQESYCLPVG